MSEEKSTQGVVLVIEQDEDTLAAIQYQLSEMGLKVITALTGEDGLREASRRRPDVILITPLLADMSGVEVFRRLRKAPLTSHIPVMFVASRNEARPLLQEGADDVITRPFDFDILALRVRNAVRRMRREGLTEPRTGLPTGPLIADKVEEFEAGQDWCRLDLTIADFDAFRSRYDFLAGIEALRFVANSVCEIVTEVGTPDDFVGHYGDNHFVVLTTRPRGQALRDAMRGHINEGLRQFYGFVEREQGYVLIDDGMGETVPHPLMSVEIDLQVGTRGERDHSV